MSETWNRLARDYGRRSVMSIEASDAAVQAETKRQIKVLAPLIAKQLTGDEKLVLDFGCGAGRFCEMLDELCPSAWVVGYDPCQMLLTETPIVEPWEQIIYVCQLHNAWQPDVIFVAMVLGDPDLDVTTTAKQIADHLGPEKLLILIDHMPDEQPQGRWWQFRPVRFYTNLFAALGIPLDVIGHDYQLANEITVLAGRKQA